MDFLYDFIKSYWYYIVIGILVLLLAGTTSFLVLNKEECVIPECDTVAYIEPAEESNKIYVDVKGAVKTPGVYEMDSTNIINDVIKAAGGFTSKAYTNNINLSKKLVSEMVIYVYTKTEYKKLNTEEVTTTTNCSTSSYDIVDCIDNGSSVITPSTSIVENAESSNEDVITSTKEDTTTNTEEVTNDKISINTATKEELMKLNGIGESKAENIIKYREENGSFKTIEDIKNVSGIGEAAYEKIKDSITV